MGIEGRFPAVGFCVLARQGTQTGFLARLALIAALSAAVVYGQADRGVISGHVRDMSNAMIPEANVSAVHVSTGVASTTRSNEAGEFTIPALPAGTYRLTITREGFKSFVQSGITLIAGGETRVAAILEVGAISESVQVSGNVEQLQTANATVSSQVSNRSVDELPLLVGGSVRSAFDLASITPQAKGSGDTFILGGGQAAAYGITLDGVTANIARYSSPTLIDVNTPSLEAITEFTVATNGFKAENGRAGGGTMTFTSKSGTNNLHGSAYEFMRNDAFDARSFFDPKRQVYKQHDFGFSAGGPVYLPKLYDGRDRTFFFFSEEWFRNRVGATNSFLSLPTPEMYQGDFSKWVDGNGRFAQIYDPTTTRPNPSGSGFIRDPFPGNLIPQSQFSSFAVAYLKQIGNIAFPNTGATPGTAGYVQNNYLDTTGSSVNPWNKIDTKIDHNFTANDRVSLLFHWGVHNTDAGVYGFPGLPSLINSSEYSHFRTTVWRPVYTKVIRGSIVNSLYGGRNGLSKQSAVLAATGGWKAKGICLIGAVNCDYTLPTITFSDYPTWGGSAGDGAENFAYSIGDDLTVTHGRHTLKFGFLWERLDYNGFGRQTISGSINGNRLMTSIPGNNNLSTGGGNGFASFLLGQAFSGATMTDNYALSPWVSYAWYAQDDIHVTPRLTLNVGLRYEFTSPPFAGDDGLSDFSPTKPNPAAGGIPGALIFAGSGPGRENSHSITPGWYGGVGPRLGFAYSINNKTVIRAAGARSFGIVKTVSGSTHFDGFQLRFNPSSTDNGITPAFLVDKGLPTYTLPPIIDPSFSNGNSTPYWNNQAVRLPEEYDWTFSIQRQLGSGTTLQAAYNATIGAHLSAGLLNINQLPFSDVQKYGPTLLQSSVSSAAATAAGIRLPYPGFSGSVAQALRPYPQYLTIDTAGGNGDKSGHSTYHSLVLQINHGFSHGFTLHGSYVLSKLLTDSDSSQVGSITSLDTYNRRLEKSIGAYDQTHNFKFDYVWQLPFGRGERWMSRGFASSILGGWRFAGILNASSGTPFALTNNNTYPVFNVRSPATVTTYDGWLTNLSNPNWFGNDRYFQPPSYFGPQPADRLGNATRYNPKARGAPSFGNNVSLAKSVTLHESMRVDFRVEAFNLINHPRLTPQSSNLSAANFGVVRSQANSPRQLQLALKFYF